MSLILLSLATGGQLLYSAILIFLMAIPSGMGLGIGLHLVKRFIRWRDRKKIPTAEQRVSNDYKDFVVPEEVAAVGTAQ